MFRNGQWVRCFQFHLCPFAFDEGFQFIMAVIITFICQLGTSLGSPGKRDPQLKTCPDQTGLRNIFLIVNWYRRVKPVVCGAGPGPVGLGCIGHASKRARRNKSVSSSIPSWLLLQDLVLSSCLGFPFLTKSHPSHSVYHGLRKTSSNIVSLHNFILYGIYFIPTYFRVKSPLFTFIIEKFEY